MRAGHHVPTEDFSVQGQRVTYTAKFRGQEVQLKGTVIFKIWDRSYGMDFYRIQPDLLEGPMQNLTTYALSVRKSSVVIEEV